MEKTLKEKLDKNFNYGNNRKYNEEIYQEVKEAVLDLYKYDEWKQERIKTKNELFGKTEKEKEIHLYFKIKYKIRLFESNDIDVYEVIFGDFK